VIASAVQGLKEIVQDGVTGLVVPADDVHALADAVQRLEEDWLLAQTLASSGQLRARERFGVDRYAERLRDLVTGLAAGADVPVVG
jgi:hypothetical protein